MRWPQSWTRGAVALTLLLMLTAPIAAAGAQALPLAQGLAGLGGFGWRKPSVRVPPPWAIACLAFLGWLIVSVLWSSAGTTQWTRLLSTCAMGTLCVLTARALGEAQQRWLRTVVIVGAGLLAAMLALEALTHNAINGMTQPGSPEWALNKNPSKGVVVLLCMLAPISAWLLGAGVWRTALGVLLALAGSWLSLQFDSATNSIAYLAAASALALAFTAPRVTLVAGSVLAAVWALAAPWVLRALPLNDALPYSWAARLHVWRYAGDRVAERPLFGRGFDASRTFHDTVLVQGQTHDAIPLHPHNVFVQVWLETGAIGAALLAVALLVVGWSAARANFSRRAIAGAMGAAGAIFAIDNLSFGAWQEWWVATGFLAAILVALTPSSTALAPK